MKIKKSKTKTISFFLILALIVGCSTATRSEFYGGLIGSILGGTIGAMSGEGLSPPGKFNQNANTALGATIGVATGGLAGAWLGRYFYGENPENRELKQMIHTDKEKPILDLGIGNQEIKINAQLEPSKRYNIPTEQIPEEIRKKMKSPVVIEHKVKEQFIELPDNKSLYVPEFKVMEQTYEEKDNEQ